MPGKFVTETGVKLSARRELACETKDGGSAIDVFYVFANTKENAKPIDGWFRLRKLNTGRCTGSFSMSDGRGGIFFAKKDRAFFMDPVTGKIGEAEVRELRDNGTMEIRIRMKPGETQVVRVVRERVKGMEGIGFQEFESLPKWEYEETAK